MYRNFIMYIILYSPDYRLYKDSSISMRHDIINCNECYIQFSILLLWTYYTYIIICTGTNSCLWDSALFYKYMPYCSQCLCAHVLATEYSDRIYIVMVVIDTLVYRSSCYNYKYNFQHPKRSSYIAGHNIIISTMYRYEQ